MANLLAIMNYSNSMNVQSRGNSDIYPQRRNAILQQYPLLSSIISICSLYNMSSNPET